MKVLVVGGTRYFGIPMVNALLAKGHDVTVATRGNAKVDFDGEVSYAESKLGKNAILDESGDAAPFNGLTGTLSFNTEKAKEAGYTFSDLDSWIYRLIDHEM